jgi:hypothetical protein
MYQSAVCMQPFTMLPNLPTDDPNKPLAPATLRYLRAALNVPHPADEPFVLSEREARHVRRVHRQTLGLAALLGLVGMVAFYGPQRWWPDLFGITRMQFGDRVLSIPLLTGLYGLLIAYLEVYLVVAVNLRTMRHIMAVFHFPRAHDGQYTRHLAILTRSARERPCRNLLQVGIDPHSGVPRQNLNLFFIATTAVALFTFVLTQWLLGQVAGRFALNQVITSWVSLPILALWNVWATEAVLRETSIRVMAPLTIREFVNELYEQWGHHAGFKSLILETLQFAGVLAGQHNYAHLVLTETITHRFSLDLTQTPTGQLLTLLAQQPVQVRRSAERLLIFCVLIDGQVSGFDKQQLTQFDKSGWLTHTLDQIDTLGTDYRAGKGLWV